MVTMQRLLSGIQPTSGLTLGNYLGAIKNWHALQHQYDSYLFIADLHALTSQPDPATLHKNTRMIAATYVACGLDPDKVAIFPQSRVSAHAELNWILSCHAPLGWLNRMTQFKDKAGKHKENAPLGLYAYPVLQAADILLYQAAVVPVGEDQKQHLELCRDIATKFNSFYGVDFFTIPEPLIMGEATRVMSLRDGTKKMSKSDESDASRINLHDEDDVIRDKIRKAKTDADALPSEVAGLVGRPEADNLVTIYAELQGKTKAAALSEIGGQGFSKFKQTLMDALINTIAPIRTKLIELEKNPEQIETILIKGTERALATANPTLTQVQKIVGLG